MKQKILGLAFLGCFSTAALAVNVNTATAEQIAQALNGIGLKKAELIAVHCQAVKCEKPEDLLQVKGIGEKTLEKIKADLEF